MILSGIFLQLVDFIRAVEVRFLLALEGKVELFSAVLSLLLHEDATFDSFTREIAHLVTLQ